MSKHLFAKALVYHYPLNIKRTSIEQPKIVIKLIPHIHSRFRLYRDKDGNVLLSSYNIIMNLHSQNEFKIFCDSHKRAFGYYPKITTIAKEFENNLFYTQFFFKR